MKNIKISREIRNRLVDIGDGRSINKTMRMLLEDAEPVDLSDCVIGLVNINMDDDLWEKLSKCREYPNESFTSIIHRLIQTHNKE